MAVCKVGSSPFQVVETAVPCSFSPLSPSLYTGRRSRPAPHTTSRWRMRTLMAPVPQLPSSPARPALAPGGRDKALLPESPGPGVGEAALVGLLAGPKGGDPLRPQQRGLTVGARIVVLEGHGNPRAVDGVGVEHHRISMAAAGPTSTRRAVTRR